MAADYTIKAAGINVEVVEKPYLLLLFYVKIMEEFSNIRFRHRTSSTWMMTLPLGYSGNRDA